MTVHECPRCGARVKTSSTCAGPFELPPKLYCLHNDPPEQYEIEMEVL